MPVSVFGVRILASLLSMLGASALFCACLVALGAGLRENDCSSSTSWEVTLIAATGLLWLGALAAYIVAGATRHVLFCSAREAQAVAFAASGTQR
jgi:uncharacterized RDD family membrane protein YckC